MRMVELIEKKKNKNNLSEEEIAFIIGEYVNGKIPDYQMSALLMAIYFNGMNNDEIFYLTNEMLKSGDSIDLSRIEGIKCDKHSTGGVGDKTSLVVGPLASALGVKIAKMSGRGLGHTGGTLDKLESIPGFRIELDSDSFFKQVNEIGIAIIGQSKNIAPADKQIYALRDVTATVDSIPLIASSIMSKKLASGADHIVLDVKVGSGAFMKDIESAVKLSKIMVEIGRKAKKDVVATITDMSQPLGFAIGNSLEIIEAVETLKGRGPKDFTKLCIELTIEILLVCKQASSYDEAKKLVEMAISNGLGLEKLREMIKYQEGNDQVIDDYSILPIANERIDLEYESDENVYVETIDALMIGEAAMLLGAGRATIDDKIDLGVGIVLNKKVGDKISKGDILATIYTNGQNTEQTLISVHGVDLTPCRNLHISGRPACTHQHSRLQSIPHLPPQKVHAGREHARSPPPAPHRQSGSDISRVSLLLSRSCSGKETARPHRTGVESSHSSLSHPHSWQTPYPSPGRRCSIPHPWQLLVSCPAGKGGQTLREY